jgi:hypothetical protein
MEIIKQISQQTGIDERQAQDALNGLNDNIHNNVPGPLGDLIGGILSGNSPAAQGDGQIGLDDLLSILGGGQGGAQGGQGGLGDLVGGILGGGQQQGGQQGGMDIGDLVGGILGGQQGGQQGGFGLDDLIGMIAGGGAQGGLNRDSLVNDISNRSGVSQDIASQILPIVLSFLAAKLGPQLGDALQGILGGGQTQGGQGRSGNDGFGLDDVLGGILGGGR